MQLFSHPPSCCYKPLCFFPLLWNIKEEILRNFSMFFVYKLEVKTVWLPTFFKISSFMLHRRKNLTQVLSSLSLRCHAHGPLAKRLMHMAHLSGKTSGVSKSSTDWLNYTGFPRDVCVTFFNVPPGNKDAVAPNPLTKEESRRVYKCDDECLSGSTKRWIFKSMWNISSSRHRIFKICPRICLFGLLLWWHFHTPKRNAERN